MSLKDDDAQWRIRLNQARTAEDRERLYELRRADAREQQIADIALSKGTNNYSRRS